MNFLARLIDKLRGAQHSSAALPGIDPAALQQRLCATPKVLVLDVRNVSEFNGPLGHIPDARNIPLAELPQRLADLDAYRARPIAVVCLTDMRSTRAIHVLRNAGFSDLLLVRGGMKEWVALRQPVEGATRD